MLNQDVASFGGRSPDAEDLGRPRRLLAATGDPNDPSVMSGLPYHFLLYGRRAGVIDGAATRSLEPPRLVAARYAWNLWRVLTLRGKGGHQYTRGRMEGVWLPVHDGTDRPVVVINIFQLFPQPLVEDTNLRRWFFIDQTLAQLFDTYGQAQTVGRGIVDRTVAKERAGYHSAEMVVANSQWAKDSLVRDYGVPPEKVAVVLQAANFHPEAYEEWAQQWDPLDRRDTGVVRLVFVGGDPYRKGLDRLLSAMQRANADRHRVSLDVLGCPASELPSRLAATPHVRWHGFVDKRRDQRRFLDLVSAADVGCLLSRAEAGGNSLREYHACGLAVLGTTAGGASDQTLPEATWLVHTDEDDDTLADRLRWLSENRGEIERRRAHAWAHRREVLWPATMAHVAQLLRAHEA